MYSASKDKEHQMNFPIFKKAIKQIPIAENDIKIEELKLEWKKQKMKLEEVTDKAKRKEIEDSMKQFRREIR